MFEQLADKYGDAVAVTDPHRREAETLSFRTLYHRMREAAAGLAALGLQPGEVVAQFADNSSRWLLLDQGVMMNSAKNAVRGAAAPSDELRFIAEHVSCCGLVLQDAKLLERVLPWMAQLQNPVRFIVLMFGDPPCDDATAGHDATIVTFDQLRSMGQKALDERRWSESAYSSLNPESAATLVFTSGTTSTPKAAMLSHGNIMYQVENMSYYLQVEPGKQSLSILPPWHIYERTTAYYILSCGGCMLHSSIPRLKRDLAKYRPDYLVCVPLLLDTLHSRIMATISGFSQPKKSVVLTLLHLSRSHVQAKRLLDGVSVQHALERPSVAAFVRALLLAVVTALPFMLAKLIVFKKLRDQIGIQTAVISGGGSLAPHLDDFYEMMGLPVLNGWGLTETSPVLACRRLDDAADASRNVRGSVGPVIPGTHVKIVDPNNSSREVLDGEVGVMLANGPGVFQCYYNDPQATENAFQDGYFVTGDLGYRVPEGNLMSGQLVLTGRAKDTIVMAGGENVAPGLIEDALCSSPLITHAMLLGQSKRTLGCLISPDLDALQDRMKEAGDERNVTSLSQAEMNNALLAEVKRVNALRPGRQVWEVITQVQTLATPFSVDKGTLTQTMKLRRPAVMDQYAADVESLLDRLR